jgi:hypothetical protein
LDVVAGVRLWSVGTTLSFNGGRLDGRDADDKATWVDGMVGLRGKYFMTPEWYLSGWALAGAGGADVDWDVAGVVGSTSSTTASQRSPDIGRSAWTIAATVSCSTRFNKGLYLV